MSWERPVGPPTDVTENHNTLPLQSGKASLLIAAMYTFIVSLCSVF